MVLLAFADHARNRGDEVYPGLDTIILKTSLSRRTVLRTIDKLKKKGVLSKVNHNAPGHQARWRIEIDHLESHPNKRVKEGKKSGDKVTPMTVRETGARMTPIKRVSGAHMTSMSSETGVNMTSTGAKSGQGLKEDACAESPKTIKKEINTRQQQSHTPNAVLGVETESENTVVDDATLAFISGNSCNEASCDYHAGFPCQTTRIVLDALSAEAGYNVQPHSNIHATAHTHTLDDILMVYRHLRLTLKPTDTFLQPRSWMSPKIFPEKLSVAKAAGEGITTTSLVARNMTDAEWDRWYVDNGYVNQKEPNHATCSAE